MKQTSTRLLLAVCLMVLAGSLGAQSVTLPPSGGNQKAEVSQWIGLVKLTLTYSSPDVTDPQGNSRRGKIWGQLVPYGMAPNSFGTAREIPWRAGANENTTFTCTHDVLVEGQELKAGTYGLHLIPRENEAWTLIFSNNHTAWGSFFYDPAEDALRVEVQPEDAPYTEWLTYEFIDRQPSAAVCALRWEEKQIPFKIEVPNLNELYVENMQRELQSTAGFSWQGYQSAAAFCLTNNTHLEQGLEWAEAAVSAPFIGQKNFQTLGTRGLLQYALGEDEQGQASLMAALKYEAQPFQYYQVGSSLIGMEKNDAALAYFTGMAEKLPGHWMSYAGLAAGNRVTGNTKEALKYYKKALEGAPPNWKPSLEQRIASLENAPSAKNR